MTKKAQLMVVDYGVDIDVYLRFQMRRRSKSTDLKKKTLGAWYLGCADSIKLNTDIDLETQSRNFFDEL